ncbi:asparagine synthase [Sporosarcina sp. ANT_H38]|uniref:asparagine synthase n=1 Tax=Sporosarcina sp. ANT_H38 TaxID=2597358 RepID=UPI0011F3647C|nr:asparagine synthase [Sporosarcina sp. ANT_H38]KAA0955531.1 asparagine synthase [Sporosarcina sp. ANT_H38]
MPGFMGKIGEIREGNLFGVNKNQSLMEDQKLFTDFYVERRTVNKFIEDKVFEEDNNYFVLVEGVILNKHELISKYNVKSFFEAVTVMYEKCGDTFFNEFRGSFSGIFYDKKSDKKLIYTNHMGEKQVYYSIYNDELIFGSEVNDLVNYFNLNNIGYYLNEDAAYFMLTFGFMLEDQTLFKEFHKLLPGHYILSNQNGYQIIKYYELDNTPNDKESESEIIENIDRLFRQAVSRAFEKDKEYGYKHLVALSGGLDSRMTTWVAYDMGYSENIINYTFSQSDYLDETIPKKIASDLKHEWIFKSLDNGIFLKDIDNVVKMSYGNALYYGLAHGKSCLDLIDFSKMGLVHTGMLGDVVIGTFYNSLKESKDYDPSEGAYSKIISNKIPEIKTAYENEEIYKFYARGFNGANQGLLVAQEHTETYSPFCDVDFMDYCLKIPVKYRYKHYIYKKWILARYPQSANYAWEKINAKITDPLINILGREVPVKRVPSMSFNFLLKRMGIKKSEIASKQHMNPLDYWYETNSDLKEFIESYYKSNIERLNSYSELKEDCELLFRNGTNIEKNQVLTLLAVLKIYFGEDNER